MSKQAELSRRQRALADFGDFVLDHEDLDQILDEGCRLIAQALDADLAKVIEIEPDTRTGFVRAGVGWNPGVVRRARISLNARSSEAYAIEKTEPLITNDIAQETRFGFPPFLRDHGVIALINVPILLPGRRPWGVLQVDARRRRAFDQEDVEFLKTYAMVLGPVIDRFRVAAEREEARRGVAEREAALRRREADLRRVQRIGEVGGIDIDVSGGLTSRRSPEYLRIHGLPEGERVEGHGDWLARVHPEDRERAEHALLEALGGEASTYLSEYRIVRPSDGEVRWIHARADIERDADGEAVRLVGAHLDVTEQKRMQASIRESEERLGLAIEIGELASWDWDMRSGQVAWNDRHYLMQGYEIGEVTPSYEAWLARVHPGDRTETSGLIERARDEHATYVHSFRTLQPDGEVRWCSARGRFFYDPQGAPYRMVGVMEDVTERTRAQAALRESEDLRRLALVSGGMGAWRWDTRERSVMGDEPFQRLWGLPPTDQSHPVSLYSDRMFPEGAAALEAIMARRLAPGEEVHDRVQVAGGPTAGRWVQWRGRAAPEAPWIINGVSFDITDQMEAEHRLRESEERYRAILDGALDYAIFTADPDGRIETWSPGATAVFGWTAEEAIGEDVAMTFTPEDREHGVPRQELAEARDIGVASNVRWHLRSDGRRVFIEGFTRRMGDGGSDLKGFLKVGQDVTERREWEDRQKVLVAELQHRTRNLMGIVRAMADKTAQTSADFADFRVRYGDRLDALARVQGLLSRLNEHDRVTFEALLRTELAAMAGGSDKVALKGPDGVRLRSSTVQTLAMALHELATNAVKYGALGQPGGRLAVSWSYEPAGPGDKPWLHIDWRESGVVMPAQSSAAPILGQGRELIEQALPYQLGARTTYVLGQDGVHCTISVPASESGSLETADG